VTRGKACLPEEGGKDTGGGPLGRGGKDPTLSAGVRRGKNKLNGKLILGRRERERGGGLSPLTSLDVGGERKLYSQQ